MGLKKKQVGDLRLNPRNPRKVTEAKLKQLGKSMRNRGDISGIVFNRRTGHLVGGNQRSKELDASAKVVITKKFDKPNEQGTVAYGYILHQGERFSYREVDWDQDTETAAMVAANNNAGQWDTNTLVPQLKHLSSFDVDFDMDLTMFSPKELAVFDTTLVREHERKKNGGDDMPEDSPQFLVVAECENERQMKKLFDELSERGLVCRLIT